MTVRELAGLLHASVVGPEDIGISGVAKVEEATNGSVTFVGDPRYEKYLDTTEASAILVAPSLDLTSRTRRGKAYLVVADPYAAFIRCVQLFVSQVDPFVPGVHQSAVVSPKATVGRDVWVGAYAVIEEGATVGDGSRIGNHVVLGKGCVVGRECRIHSGVSIYHGCILGARVVVHSGAVIGSDGFGFMTRPDGSYEKIPQLGIVRVGDDCEIGANSTIARATVGETRLGVGVKLDNLVQVAHNVIIGDHSAAASQAGIAGSSKIGKYVRIGGQSAISGHVEVADRSTILGKTGVSKSILEPGKTWFGIPAKEHVRAGRIEAALRALPELKADVEALKEESKKKKS